MLCRLGKNLIWRFLYRILKVLISHLLEGKAKERLKRTIPSHYQGQMSKDLRIELGMNKIIWHMKLIWSPRD